MPIRQMGNANLDDLPAFERPTAQGLTLAKGNDPTAIAHTHGWGNKVFLDDPSAATQPIVAHEVMHKIQQKSGAITPLSPGSSQYDYGGLQGLKKIGGNVSQLNTEQQADVPRNYMEQMQHWQKGPITDKVLGQADQLNAAYARPIHQLANMADDQINVTPQPPGAPPAAMTGMIKQLPEMGGPSMYKVGR